MDAEGSPPASRGTEADAAPGMIADLRLRLHGSQVQELAARAEARRFAREAAVTRRLLAFCYGADARVQNRSRQPLTSQIPRVRAARLTGGALFGLDSCQHHGTYVAVAGWAFQPVPGWNGLAATVTVLFRHDRTTYAATAGRVFRADVAAHFATAPDEVTGGARSLANAGFACEVSADSLPGGVDLEVVLRLECEGLVCEQPTDRHVRL